MASITLPPNTSFFHHFIQSQFRTTYKPPPASTNLSGQTTIITGSNTGIGYEACKVLLGFKLSHLIIAVRSAEKGEQAAVPLRKAYSEAQIDVWSLDMLSYDSIQAFARKCSTLTRLDTVILNAGLSNVKFEINASTGHETTFQVNYISTTLLAILLLPILKAKSPPGTPGRLTLVASCMGWNAAVPNRNAVPIFPTFDDSTNWNISAAAERYSVSKLMVLMLSLRLGDLVSPDDVIINSVEPGLVGGTGLQRSSPGAIKFVINMINRLVARTTLHGAWTYADAAIVKGRETHGSFIVNWQIYPYAALMYTEEGKRLGGQIWKETMEELNFAGVEDILASM
ncbi:short-chain dehydrogenase/reductase family protein [Pleomassaria siparia CBS 279.74]|uniref:Short-chain dehydrogenase/reductase family protein n=1 Tax=Pleomassaria siparia CBS 279.74 TaxID=1314801 RepID=A0A6G1K367_9PLEO|nr:short-chain dehydrogenase/reductase family protein [Pleomassaria siparia CBS 279.74]